MPITTTEEKSQRRLEVKARSTLMIGIPNKHQLNLNSIKDAKQLLEAVEKIFGKNATTKKTQRNLLKQQFENFSTSRSEMLDQTFDRLQKLVSQFELLGEKLSQEDVNQKFLRSLSPKWNTHVVVWRNKADLDTISDDLYINLKVYEPEVQAMSSSNSNTQNMAFMSSANSSTNGVVNTAQAVNTANGVSTASTQVNTVDNLSDALIYAFMASQSNSPQLAHDGLLQLPQEGTLARECRALRNQDTKHKERRSVPVETPTSTALMSCDGDEEENVTQPKIVKKTVRPRIVKKEFVKPRQQEKTARKTVKKTIKKLIEDMLLLEETPKEGNHKKRVLRKNNMYSVDLKNIIPKGGLTFLFAKATSDESKLWHRRLGHLNFKTMNKLVKGNLVRGKFNGKADEGFFVGYSLNSKAFRVFNSRTRIVEENLHIRFSESLPNVVGTKASDNAGQASMETQPDDGYKPSSDDGKKVDEDPSKETECNDQEKENNVNIINNVNTVSLTVNAAGTNEDKELLFDLKMPDFEDVGTFDFSNEDEDDNIVAGTNNMDITIQFSHIPSQTQEEGIDYDEVFDSVERIEVIRIFLAYASFKDFVVYQMDVKSAFLYGKIEKEVYQVNPKVSHLHAVKRIFSDYAGASLDRKFTTGDYQFIRCRLISWQHKKQTVVANSKTEAEYVAASSYYGQVLWIQNQLLDYGYNFMHSKIFIDNNSITYYCQLKVNAARLDGKEIIITKLSIRRYLRLADKEGVDCLPNSTIFENLELMGLVRAATTASSLEVEQDSGNIYKTQSKATPNEASSPRTTLGAGPRCQEAIGDTIAQTRFENAFKLSNDSLLARGNTLQSNEDRLKLNELIELCTNLQSRVLHLEKTKTTQALEITSLKKRVKKLKKKQRSRTHKFKRLYKVGLIARVDSSEDDQSLVNDQDDAKMFDVNDLKSEEVFIKEEVADKEVNASSEVYAASIATNLSDDATITADEITLAQAHVEIKTSKPKDKGIVLQEPKKRRKFFATKTAKEKRNKPPIEAQQRKIMCTYLKNMEGKKLKDLKNKSFDSIQKMFDRAFNRVNTFVDFRTELVEGSSNRAGKELIQ
uniref:Ribonuclease H-like domain-containing protein n=1 Tax=Tanacetum cinerariifolium TaxID=118510 RepID=A0A6L2P0H8_TANCI|nr:ribonuclease H-like domain-containing protein [Tanacetum cinerariifolium]